MIGLALATLYGLIFGGMLGVDKAAVTLGNSHIKAAQTFGVRCLQLRRVCVACVVLSLFTSKEIHQETVKVRFYVSTAFGQKLDASRGWITLNLIATRYRRLATL
jgi:hypothetical protein